MNYCSLNLSFPRALEDDVTDYLLSHPQGIDSMSIVRAEGLGTGLALRDATERVCGRAARAALQMVLPHETALRLLADMKNDLANAEVSYWIVPVLEHGRLA